MFLKRFGGLAAAGSACLLLAACGGGGGSSSTPTTTDNTAANNAAQAAATLKAQETDVSRLAKQATFGATPALIDHMKAVGVSAWLDEQFAATGSSYTDIATDLKATDFCTATSDAVCQRHYFSREPVAMRFYQNALGQPDQLRQRVALAMSELMVASTADVSNAAGAAAFNQIFLNNAFGNFRDILQQVTMSGFMGTYLNMAGSSKNAPNENYAREMMQLFTMGPNKLNMDGTLITDSTGGAQPNYTPDDVKGVAHALTGWYYAHFNGGTTGTTFDYTQSLIAVPSGYDTTAKSFLGITIPAGASQTDSVKLTLDAAFNNSSTPPFIAKFLIQQLVTSNPSAGYIGRVAAVFVNNGANVRGDMKAVIKAILTDAEARGAAGSGDNYGKLKEPILLLTGIARAAGMTSDGVPFFQRDGGLGEPVFQSPSVFNFYPPDFPLPESSTLLSPASKLLTAGTIVGRSNLVYDWTVGSATARTEFNASTTTTGATGSAMDWSGWEAFGTDVDGMIDRIDLLFANRTLTDAQKAALKAAANAVTNTDATKQARMRAQTMLYVIFSSPLYQVDR